MILDRMKFSSLIAVWCISGCAQNSLPQYNNNTHLTPMLYATELAGTSLLPLSGPVKSYGAEVRKRDFAFAGHFIEKMNDYCLAEGYKTEFNYINDPGGYIRCKKDGNDFTFTAEPYGQSYEMHNRFLLRLIKSSPSDSIPYLKYIMNHVAGPNGSAPINDIEIELVKNRDASVIRNNNISNDRQIKSQADIGSYLCSSDRYWDYRGSVERITGNRYRLYIEYVGRSGFSPGGFHPYYTWIELGNSGWALCR